MKLAEFCRISPESVTALLAAKAENHRLSESRRATPRWPFPGAVELWVPAQGGGDRHTLASCHNLSTGGVGIRCDEALPLGLDISLAVHQPEASLHGRATVRHCSRTANGDFMIGLQFLFDD